MMEKQIWLRNFHSHLQNGLEIHHELVANSIGIPVVSLTMMHFGKSIHYGRNRKDHKSKYENL